MSRVISVGGKTEEKRRTRSSSSMSVADMGFARCASTKCTCFAKGFTPHHELAHTCKMCTTNTGCTKMCVARKSMYIVCTLRVESEVHPSPICRRQLAQPTLFRIREIGARVKICLFIENPSPVSKAPDQVPREGTPCNDRYKAAEKNLALSLDGVFSIVPWLFI